MRLEVEIEALRQGLPTELVGYVKVEGKQTAKVAVERLAKAFKSAVEAASKQSRGPAGAQVNPASGATEQAKGVQLAAIKTDRYFNLATRRKA